MSIIKYVAINYRIAFYLLDALLDLLQCKHGYRNSSLIQSLWLHSKAINGNHQTIYRLWLSLKNLILNDIYLYLIFTAIGGEENKNSKLTKHKNEQSVQGHHPENMFL